MRYIQSILLIFMLFSCNSVKKVNRSQEKQLKVIEDYGKKTGLKSDTILKHTGSDTTINEIVYYDTVIIPCPNGRYVSSVGKNITKEKVIRDTFVKTIRDYSIANGYREMLDNERVSSGKIKEESFKIENSRDKWRFRFFILLGVSIVAIFIKLKFFKL